MFEGSKVAFEVVFVYLKALSRKASRKPQEDPRQVAILGCLEGCDATDDVTLFVKPAVEMGMESRRRLRVYFQKRESKPGRARVVELRNWRQTPGTGETDLASSKRTQLRCNDVAMTTGSVVVSVQHAGCAVDGNKYKK
jgi:hypothetical protein